MYYCEKCRINNEWPEAFVRSVGKCECCGKPARCHDRPSSTLPQVIRATPSSADSVAGGGADCGACPGDGSICKSLCKLAAESPPTTTAPVSVAEGVPAEGEVQSEEAKLYRDLTGDATAMGYEGLVDALQALRKLKDQVSDADGELPPLPKPAAKFYELDDFGNTVGRDTDDYTEKQMLDYARAAIAADRARRGEPVDGDAIAKSKHILALVDAYVEHQTADNRTALRHALMDEFEPDRARFAGESIDTPEYVALKEAFIETGVKSSVSGNQSDVEAHLAADDALAAHIVAKLAAARRAAGSGAGAVPFIRQKTNPGGSWLETTAEALAAMDPRVRDVFDVRTLYTAPVGEAVRDGWSNEPPTEQGWYWHWWGDTDQSPFPVSVLYSGTAKKCFVAMNCTHSGQAEFCDTYGGYWKRIHEPEWSEAPTDAPAGGKEGE